ncbi:MAG: phosphoglucosamine mutase [Hyphomonadaceae bacterium]|nr:phosphoglucosamine mutase [Hyphomonadaceae bacterium]
MSRRFFGTDGIRGRANEWPMTAEVAMALGMAAGTVFKRDGHRQKVIIGKDTRRSGYMIEFALVSGFTAVGMDVRIIGPIPTPAVGLLSRSLRADLGVMISASHNGYEDNGIKLFGADGFKISDAEERAIEELLDDTGSIRRAAPDQVGQVKSFGDSIGRYVEFAKGAFPRHLSLDGLRVVVDCANGAAYKTAPWALYELGAEVVEIGVDPDGMNINKGCGSTNVTLLRDTVLERRADIGIALDGDADRIIIVDEKGTIVDGDQIIAAIANGMIDDQTLTGGGVVTTIMSNLGLERFIESKGVTLHRTGVGDRQVVARMRADGCNLGGEQSGHVVLLDYATTGDGLVSALRVLAAMVARDRKASEVLSMFEPVPQLLKNVRYGKVSPLADPAMQARVSAAEDRLAAAGGRLVVRTSGTEPLVRLMGEAPDATLLETVIAELAEEMSGRRMAG